MVDKDILIQELINKQKNIDILSKLSFKEFLRIVKNVDSSLFSRITVIGKDIILQKIIKYINFFFHQKNY